MAELGSREERVACRTPNSPNGRGVRIPKWKFDIVRTAILNELQENDVLFVELPDRAGARLPPSDRSRMGSVGWHVTTVKLELEVRGEIRRVPGPGKQMLSLAR